jgi:versiconal hemiacetal acetate esterase
LLIVLDAYGSPTGDKYANPLLHDKLSQLPKVYMSWCGQDTLRDDGRLMKDALQTAGVQVEYEEFGGYPHYFWTFPTPELKEAAQDYRQKVAKGIKFVLS